MESNLDTSVSLSELSSVSYRDVVFNCHTTHILQCPKVYKEVFNSLNCFLTFIAEKLPKRKVYRNDVYIKTKQRDSQMAWG